VKFNVKFLTKNKTIGLLAGLLLVLQTQATMAQSSPDWVNGDAGFYPNHQYLSATGSASKSELAKDRALGNLAKILELQIREDSNTVSATHVSVKNAEESVSKSIRLVQQINIRTDKVIQGARIAEMYHDGQVFTYHALAVLDRKQAGTNIRGEIQRLDQETAAEFNRSQSKIDALLSMAALNKAMILQLERQTLQQTLKVIDASGKGQPSKWNMAELRGKFDNSLQSLRIATAIDNDPIGRLGLALKSAMGNAGFPAVNNSADFTLVANLDVQDLGFRQGWYWLRGKLSIKLVEAGGKIRGRKQWPLKVSALQRNDSESRLMTQVSKKLNAELRSAMIEFSTGVH
jgi:hypothetical protein